MRVKAETSLKAMILTHGVIFTDAALEAAASCGAKRQNLVYNAPVGASNFRPQELLISSKADGYTVAVSCVAPNTRDAIVIDSKEGVLTASMGGKMFDAVNICYVKEPSYYSKCTSDGSSLRQYLSSCGLDEMNIIPWKGCAISAPCLFCGANVVARDNDFFELTASNVSFRNAWLNNKDKYLSNLVQAVSMAKEDECFAEHMHVIIISGDLCDEMLDYQAKIYAQIAHIIRDIVSDKSREGIIAVMMPPKDLTLLKEMKASGIDKIVFNFEVGNSKLFDKYCPGKKNIGREHIYTALKEALGVFGQNNVWTNFVLGLEPIDGLLSFNRELAINDITSSANVLHLDRGNSLDCAVPSYETVVSYFFALNKILLEYDMRPFYCSKALRTSLSNEAYDKRIERWGE